MNPTISVIIPVYNRLHLLGNVVESILGQTLPVTEVILIDDGSTEHTPEMVERYIQGRPAWRERVRYHYQENQGQSVASNVGVAMAKGEWLGFDGNDDLWLPQKLEWQFKALEKYKGESSVCFTDAWFMNNPYMKMTLFQFAGTNYFTEAPKELKGDLGLVEDPVRLLLRHRVVWMQTVVARTDLVRRLGGADPKLRFSEDFDFAFRLAVETKFCYVNMPMVLIDRPPSAKRHIGAAENWKKKDFKLTMDGRRLEKQLSLTEGMAPDIRQEARRNLRAHYSKWANWYLANRDYKKALESVTTAAKYHLDPGIAIKWVLTRLFPRLASHIVISREQRDMRNYYGVNW